MNLSINKSVQMLGIALVAVFIVTAPATTRAQYLDDNLGYADLGGFGNAGYTDYAYGNAGYTDYSNLGNAGYTDYSYPSAGYTDYSTPSAGYTDYASANPGYTDYSYPSAGYTDYTYPSANTTAYDVYDTYDTYSSYSSPLAYNMGYSYPSYLYPNYASSYPTYPRYQQPIVQTPQPNVTNVTTNTCTGGSCNRTNVDNSIRDSYNDNSIRNSGNTTTTYTPPVITAPIYYAQPQPIVQYQVPTYQNTYCTISVSPNYIQNGGAAYLTWSSNGMSAYLSDGIGAVSPNGSLAVRPNTTRTYVLTVYGQGGSNSCSTVVSVNAVAPTVSLSQIPYTGFDYGTFGNTIYWLSLAAFAIALSYLVLYFKGGAMAIAGAMMPRKELVVSPVQVAHVAPAHEEVYAAHAHERAPVAVAEHGMKDTMSIVRDHDGNPRIVIQRA